MIAPIDNPDTNQGLNTSNNSGGKHEIAGNKSEHL